MSPTLFDPESYLNPCSWSSCKYSLFLFGFSTLLNTLALLNVKETTWNCRIRIYFDRRRPDCFMKAYIGFYKKSCHCRVDMVVRRRKVMAMKGRLYVCFSAGNWYYYKVVTIAKKFTWSWACYNICLSADNFKNPTLPGWARPTSSPGLFPQKMGGAPPNFWGESPGDEVGARHGWAILVFRL